jgi:hypothetical protein
MSAVNAVNTVNMVNMVNAFKTKRRPQAASALATSTGLLEDQ